MEEERTWGTCVIELGRVAWDLLATWVKASWGSMEALDRATDWLLTENVPNPGIGIGASPCLGIERGSIEDKNDVSCKEVSKR